MSNVLLINKKYLYIGKSDKMGISKISGIVINNGTKYMKIIRDNRTDGGYDLLIRDGAAKNLKKFFPLHLCKNKRKKHILCLMSNG